jgi:hypothetical protein
MGNVFNKAKFVHMGGIHVECRFDNRCGNVADSTIAVVINTERDVTFVSDKPSKSLYDLHGTYGVAWGRVTGVTGVLALFTVLAFFVCNT